MSSTTKSTETQGISCEELYRRILTDIHDMLDFARAEGLAIPPDLRAKITELCYGETEKQPSALETPKEISTPARAILQEPAEAKALPGSKEQPAKMSLALEAHASLTQVVAPAIPRTIRASRSTGKLKLVADNLTVKLLLCISILSLVAFLSSAVWLAEKAAVSESARGGTNAPGMTNTITTTSNSNRTEVVASLEGSKGRQRDGAPIGAKEISLLLAAASLGSAFYGLYTAHKYIVNFTFDPKYHQVYLIRYVLGLSSGTILGYFGNDLLDADSEISQRLGTAVLALIGGYAAEAVSQILQRFSETLVTMVRGSNADVLRAKQEELKAKSRQQETEIKADVAQALQKVKDEIARTAPNSPLLAEIQKELDSLKK